MAARNHKHWPEDHPFYERAPWCDLPTKGACDQRWTEFLHGHPGHRCVKRIQESKTKKGQPNKLATCILVNLPDSGQSMSTLIESARKAIENAVHQR